ncbi:hypothetical protein X975_25374, partial [Stegodyphus mimosarum]
MELNKAVLLFGLSLVSKAVKYMRRGGNTSHVSQSLRGKV